MKPLAEKRERDRNPTRKPAGRLVVIIDAERMRSWAGMDHVHACGRRGWDDGQRGTGQRTADSVQATDDRRQTTRQAGQQLQVGRGCAGG